MPTLRLPLSFSRKGGSAFKLADGTREFYDQVIHVAVMTEPGELPLDPGFGTKDPTFDKGEPVGLRATLTGFWPEISVRSISASDPNGGGSVSLNVAYEVAS